MANVVSLIYLLLQKKNCGRPYALNKQSKVSRAGMTVDLRNHTELEVGRLQNLFQENA
jgi:hypothetical protein